MKIKVGDKFWNKDRNAIATITKVNKKTMNYTWKTRNGAESYYIKVEISDVLNFYLKTWHQLTELEKVLL